MASASVPATLSEALGLGPRESIAIVGGGGKTTIMYRLAAEAAAAGRTVVVGGTARFTPPRSGSMPPAVAIGADQNPLPVVAAALAQSQAITITTGRGDKGRWLPISVDQAAAIASMPEVNFVILEADGSRNRPFKAPGPGEPVIPRAATFVLTVVGLDIVGRPLDDAWVHRTEQVSRLSGVPLGEPVTSACIARVLLHPEGGRKGVPEGARWIPVLNKAEPERRGAAEEIARQLLDGGAETVLIATAGVEQSVVAVRCVTLCSIRSPGG